MISGPLNGRMGGGGGGVAQASAWLKLEEFTQSEFPLCFEKKKLYMNTGLGQKIMLVHLQHIALSC